MLLEPRHYLYRHIRLDKNEPFYIGVGTKHRKNDYNRAKSTRTRNVIWNSIYKKTEIDVEILFESDSMDVIAEKEKEFILLYGRICKGDGTLANMDLGGYLYNPIKKKTSESETLRRKEHLLEMSRRNKGTSRFDINARPVYVYTSSGGLLYGFDSFIQCSIFLGDIGVTKHMVQRKIDKPVIYKGFVFCSHQKLKIDTIGFRVLNNDVDYGAKRIAKIDEKGEVICIYNTMSEAEKDNNLYKGAIYRGLKRGTKKIKNKFRYIK